MELHWSSVQKILVERLCEKEEQKDSVRIVEWFYLSNQDTLIEHGNQYDLYSLCADPVHPLIKMGENTCVRLPFGNLAGKYMLNGMGLMNPHSEASYIKSSFYEYMVFFWKYVMTTQPFIMWTWFWSAWVSLFVTLAEGLKPPLIESQGLTDRIEKIAVKANSTPEMVSALRQLHAHPASRKPFQILQELWLDRAVLAGLILFLSFLFCIVLKVFYGATLWWFCAPLGLLVPFFILYSRSVRSEVQKSQEAAFCAVPDISKIARVRRVIHGHTHHAKYAQLPDCEYLNTGTWSPIFRDVECKQPYGKKCFAWIKPGITGATGRSAGLYEWAGSTALPVGSG